MRRTLHWLGRTLEGVASLARPGATLRKVRNDPLILSAILLLSSLASGAAAIRFDVFLGYDGIVPEANWFPVVVEVQNDGPTFKAWLEVSPSGAQRGQTRLLPVELPTGTTKRLLLPAFGGSRFAWQGWDVRLVDERGRTRAENRAIRARRQPSARAPLMGALTRTLPTFPELKAQPNDGLAPVARLLPSLFPDNPLALDGLDVIYLSSEKAADLKPAQITALRAWLHAGGRLLVGVEQISHLYAAEWLRQWLPCELIGTSNLTAHAELQQWLTPARTNLAAPVLSVTPPLSPQIRRNLPLPRPEPTDPYATLKPDDRFEQMQMQVAGCTLRDGKVLIGGETQPLAVTGRRGRGEIIVLLFSPELEPFVSWQNRSYFWAKLADVPAPLLGVPDPASYNYYGGWSLDGVFGAMIDSRQVRKLPVGWLLVLLVGYLVVIGPLDHWWLKKINRQMLTWLTFPAYVALFSVLIYFIGYKLRAGETEYNELHVVDLVPVGEQTYWRGCTYASVYSPVNARYQLSNDQFIATLRGEFLANYSSGQEASRASIEQRGNSFRAEVSVPVWTSQLFISDWWRRQEPPLRFSIAAQDSGWLAQVENTTDTTFTEATLIIEGRVVEIGKVSPHTNLPVPVLRGSGTTLANFLQSHHSIFQSAVQQRQRAFGGGESGFIDDLPQSAMIASFGATLEPQQTYAGRFITPGTLDLTRLLERGDAVLLAWAPNWAPVKPMNHFAAKRGRHDTLVRVSAEVNGPVLP